MGCIFGLGVSMGKIIKIWICIQIILNCTSCLSSAEELSASTTILLYHEITNESANDFNNFSVTVDSFVKQMQYISENCNVISLEEYVKCLKTNKKKNGKSVVVTFDDGYLSNYLYAFPSLKAFGIPATIFITTGNIDTKNHLSWEQVNEMVESGSVDFGSHCKTHGRLTDFTHEEQYNELKQSKEIIEHYTNKMCKYIAYPYGSANNEVIEIAKSVGYEAGVVVDDKVGIIDNSFALERYMVSGTDSVETLSSVIFPPLIGDIYEDHVINSKDAVRLAQYLAKWDVNLTYYEQKAADFCSDGIVDSRDAVKLAQYLAKWDFENMITDSQNEKNN